MAGGGSRQRGTRSLWCSLCYIVIGRVVHAQAVVARGSRAVTLSRVRWNPSHNNSPFPIQLPLGYTPNVLPTPSVSTPTTPPTRHQTLSVDRICTSAGHGIAHITTPTYKKTPGVTLLWPTPPAASALPGRARGAATAATTAATDPPCPAGAPQPAQRFSNAAEG